MHLYKSYNPNDVTQVVNLMGFWNTIFILKRSRVNNALLRSAEYLGFSC
jgi:hypothetical protein